jgi:1-deoxy-D-xylulose-5-phosphate synthase
MLQLLDSIGFPFELRRLPLRALGRLAEQLRGFVLHSVASTGGHLSANLGTVELTIALHYVFDTPRDRIVWDVGHQTYAHKTLTGRRSGMARIRQLGGMSGFPRRQESEYDTFGTAHSSTALSAALGMAIASQYKGEDRYCIAVVGDGAMSGGMAFEALNNAGSYQNLPLLVVLNDNDMSISKPVGALRQHLRQLTEALRNASRASPFTRKNAVSSGFFTALGFEYSGPVDGHDLDVLIPALKALKGRKGPQLLHVVTEKGHGYLPAASDPVLYHGPGKFDPEQGMQVTAPSKQTYTQIFTQWLCDEAELDARVMAITPAMCEGSGLAAFKERFPDRYFDVGIAEQHALTFAAGLAVEGLKPVVAIYSTFLQRGYDQLIHDIALQCLPVVFAIDRAGVVGPDGATHMGGFDIAYLRCIPNLIIMAPADENECRQMLHTALLQNCPAAVRYPRGNGTGAVLHNELRGLPLGLGEVRRRATRGSRPKVAIVVFGTLLAESLAAAERLDATVANMRFIKPLDEHLLTELAGTHDVLVTVEEGCIKGGAGSACLECLMPSGICPPTLQLGFDDQFIEHGAAQELLKNCHLDAEGIYQSIAIFMSRQNAGRVVAGGAS